jgi:hypothetical protein
MNDQVTCVVLCEGCDDATKEQVNAAMLPVAQEAFEAAKASGCESGMLFFTATENSDVVYQLRMSCELGEPTGVPQVRPRAFLCTACPDAPDLSVAPPHGCLGAHLLCAMQ